MKRLNVAKKDACMACKECVIACSEAFYKEFDEDLSCIRIDVKKRRSDSQAGCLRTVRKMCGCLSGK